MNKSRIAFLSIALATGLGSSNPIHAQLPGQPPVEVVTPPTVQERVAKLEQDLARLQRELDYLRDLQSRGGLTAEIAAQISNRSANPRIIDAGAGLHPSLQPLRVELFSDTQRASLLPDVVVTVNDIPVREARVTELVDYLRSYRPDASKEELMSDAIMAIARAEWPKDLFSRYRTETSTKVREAHNSLNSGIEWENLVTNRSDDRETADSGGDLGFISRDDKRGLPFVMAAFKLEDGKYSGIVGSPWGLHIVKRTGFEKGETPDKDRVRVSHILFLHGPSAEEVEESLTTVDLGRARIAVRDEEFKGYIPRPYRR